MYKNLLLALLIAFIAGCSKPKADKAPSWYTNIPQDYKLFYAVGSAADIDMATKKAIVSMRESLNFKIDEAFKNKKHKLQPISSESLENILKHNLDVSKKLSLSKVKLEKSKKFKGQELVLISIARVDIFNKLKIISDASFARAKEANKRGLNKSVLDRFLALEPVVNEYAKLSSLSQYKETLISTYSASNEFTFLKDTKEEYENLKDTINVSILSDGHSRIFTLSSKKAVQEKGLAEAKVINEKLLAEADGIHKKAEAMKKLDSVGKEHEEFKLRLQKDRDVDLARITIQKDIAGAQANVISEALKAANIEIIGGETMFFDKIIGSITNGKSFDRLVDSSDVFTEIKEQFLDTTEGKDLKSNIQDFIKSFNISSEDIKNMSISALLFDLIGKTNDDKKKGFLEKIMDMVNQKGIGNKKASDFGI